MTFKEFKAAAAGEGNFELDLFSPFADNLSAIDDMEVKVQYYWFHGELTWLQYNLVREGFENKQFKKILLVKSFVPSAFPSHASVYVNGESVGRLRLGNKTQLWALITDNESEAG